MPARTSATILNQNTLDAFIQRLERLVVGRDEKYRYGGFNDILSLPFFMKEAVESRGFNVIMILGKQGSGKTYYAIQSTRFLLEMLGWMPRDLSLTEKLRFVLNNYLTFIATRDERRYAIEYFVENGQNDVAEVIKRFPSLEERMDSVSWRNPYPVLIYDDAGLTSSAYDFYRDRKHVQDIATLIQVARRRVMNIIFTTTNPKNLLMAIRDNPDRIVVVLKEVSRWYSTARGYIFPLTAVGSYVKRLFDDEFYKRVPDRFHEEYMTISDVFVDYALHRRKILEWAKEREKKRRGKKSAEE